MCPKIINLSSYLSNIFFPLYSSTNQLKFSSQIYFSHIQKLAMNEMKEEGPSIDLASTLRNNKAQNQSILSPVKTESQISSEYCEKMKNILCENHQQLKNKMNSDLIWNKKKFRTSFQKITSFKNGNSYVFYVSFGQFQTNVTLLKINMSSELLPRHQSSFGCSSSVYIQQFENHSYAIKSQKIPEQSIANFDEKFDKILQEYMICKIASTFQFGPKLKKLYLFDIICFSNSVQFSMQLCQTQSAFSHLEREKLEIDLLKGMKIMHSLHIVHRDIKPSNISWSRSYQKWVFLDFGYSRSIKQKLGEKTWAFYCGTYNYVSEELKSLFHLKQPKFVDLYANDLYGLTTSCLSFYQQNLERPKNQSWDFFTLLCRMKYFISYEIMECIPQLFVEHIQLREEFLKLLKIELDRAEQMKITQYSQRGSKYSLMYKKLNLIRVVKIQLSSIDKEIQQIEKEQKKKYFQLFMKEEQKLKSVFMLEKQQKLKSRIIQKQNQLQFMLEIFIFFQQTLSSNKENAWNRLKLITDILLQIFGFKYQQKNWVWKFHDLLIIFQEKFIEQNQYFLLKQIQEFYHIFNDRVRFRKLANLRLQKSSQYEKIVYSFHELFCQISIFSQIDFSRKKFFELKQKIMQSKYKDQQIFFLSLRITELMLSLSLLREDEKEEFKMLIEVLNKKQLRQNLASSQIIIRIKEWMASPLQQNQFQTQNTQSGGFSFFSERNYNSYLFNTVMKLTKSEIFCSSEDKKISLPSLLKLYPLLKEIPTSFAIFYHLSQGNSEKIDQIALNLFIFNKDCLQNIWEELNLLKFRWTVETLSQEIKQAQFFLKYFITSYQNKLAAESIQRYWNFYQFFFCCGRELFKNNDKLKEQFISSLQYIINFFQPEDLSLKTKIIINLFIHLKMYHKGKDIQTNQFLNKFPQLLQMEEKKRYIFLVIQFFSMHELFQSKYSLQNTSLYNHLFKKNQLYFYFHVINDFFELALFSKVSEKKQQEALNLIVEHTKYLSTISSFEKNEFFILSRFIKLNSHNKMQMMMYFLKSDFRIIRQNNYLSSLILLIYLRYEEEFLINLKFKEILRVYSLSVISIDKLFAGIQRVQLRKHLKYKFRQFEQGVKPRKKKILNHQEDYARSRIFFLQKEFERGIWNNPKYHGKFKAYFEKKKTKLQQNLKKKMYNVINNFRLVSDLL